MLFILFLIIFSDSQFGEIDSDDTLKLASSKPIPPIRSTPSTNHQPIATTPGSKTGIAHVIYKPEPKKITQRPSTLNLATGPNYFRSALTKGKLRSTQSDAADIILDKIDSEIFSMTSMQVCTTLG